MTPTHPPIVIGIDVGTSGVRSVAATAEGEVLAEAREAISDLPTEGAAHEQDATGWWKAVCNTIQELRRNLEPPGRWAHTAGIAVTSTSGSLVLTDAQGEPVRPAMLYDDGRPASVAAELNRRLPENAHVNASFSLAKALWVRQQEPEVWERASRISHPADWLALKLTGQLGLCDYSNALKLGYDHEKGEWAAAVVIADIPAFMLPRIVALGDQVGTVSAPAARQTGLPAGVPVLAGASDGLASLIGSGASKAGHANTTLGTTLVWKVLTSHKPALGPGMYCHHLPNDMWVPGAASNTGPGSLQFDQAGVTPAEMDRSAAAYLPTSIQCYLLSSRGERFPFLNAQATSFFDGPPVSGAERHAAQLQSLACVERWGFERLERCGGLVGKKVFSAGSAALSPVLAQLRANVLKRSVVRTANPTASFGAAILAARTTLFGGDLTAAMRSMTRIVESYSPVPELLERYERAYQQFRAACAAHGYDDREVEIAKAD
jgi:sugar (pentulose or hexulose) kinase